MKKLLLAILALGIILPSAVAAKPLYQYGSFSQRAVMAVNHGVVKKVGDYRGTYSQNISLLKALSKEALGGTSDPFQPSGISINIREGLAAGSARTQTTLNIDPIITLDSHRVTFADFNSSIAFAKLDQGTSNEEIISFTGITDNTTYYTLTGVVWGYDFYRVTGSIQANKKKHNSGGKFVISTDFHFINSNYVSIGSAQTITGTKTFASSTYPKLDSYLAPTDNAQFAPKKYVDDVALAGAPDATETVRGVSELATGAELAAGTSTGDTGARLVAPGSAFTNVGGTANKVPVTAPDGKLAQGFIDQTDNYSWTGQHLFQDIGPSGPTLTVTGTTSLATTTISITPTASNHVANKNYVDTLSVRAGLTSKNAADASATTTIAHNLGRTPRSVYIKATSKYGGTNINVATAEAWYASSTQYSLSTYVIGSFDYSVDTTFTLNTSNTNGTTVGVVTVDATNIYIAWTKTGSPTGTYNLLWKAE